MKRYCSFYALKGENDNYHFTFKVDNQRQAERLYKKFPGVRAAYYIEKTNTGFVTTNIRLF